MNILEDTNEVLKALGIPIETGIFKSEAPDTYIVLIPLMDTFPLNADDMPQTDMQELRITLFSKGNYIKLKNKITAKLLSGDFCITGRRYNGFDTGASYHQYTIDVAKNYEIMED